MESKHCHPALFVSCMFICLFVSWMFVTGNSCAHVRSNGIHPRAVLIVAL